MKKRRTPEQLQRHVEKLADDLQLNGLYSKAAQLRRCSTEIFTGYFGKKRINRKTGQLHKWD